MLASYMPLHNPLSFDMVDRYCCISSGQLMSNWRPTPAMIPTASLALPCTQPVANPKYQGSQLEDPSEKIAAALTEISRSPLVRPSSLQLSQTLPQKGASNTDGAWLCRQSCLTGRLGQQSVSEPARRRNSRC